MALAHPLTGEQLDAASALHAKLVQWRVSDEALEALQNAMPDFSPASALLKVVAINQLYGTRLYAVTRMGQHVCEVLSSAPAREPGLVDRLALLPVALPDDRQRRHVSFASKFAHFFLDRDRFPIYDSYAVSVLKWHLGRDHGLGSSPSYVEWVEAFRRLQHGLSRPCSSRELDRYLWLTGLVREWRKVGSGAQINAEVLRRLEDGADDALVRAIG